MICMGSDLFRTPICTQKYGQQDLMKGLSCRRWRCVILPYQTPLRLPLIIVLSGLRCWNKGTSSRSCDLCVFQTAGRRSFAAPSDGARRPASPWRWGTEWHGRAARTQLMAAPTQTAPMERECPARSSSTHPPIYSIHLSLFCFLSLRFVFPTTRLGPESQFSDFLDGLGPAQIVGRQTLATPPMGKPTSTAFPLQSIPISSWIVFILSKTSWDSLHWHFALTKHLFTFQ